MGKNNGPTKSLMVACMLATKHYTKTRQRFGEESNSYNRLKKIY